MCNILYINFAGRGLAILRFVSYTDFWNQNESNALNSLIISVVMVVIMAMHTFCEQGSTILKYVHRENTISNISQIIKMFFGDHDKFLVLHDLGI